MWFMVSRVSRSEQNAFFSDLYAKADAAGKKAAAAFPADGFGCGFAYVTVNGNTAFGRWVKRFRGWEKDYPWGMTLTVMEYGQSENHKYAYARAFASMLNEAGVLATAKSRSD